MTFKKLIISSVCALSLVGCSLGPDFKQPQLLYGDKPWVKKASESNAGFTDIEQRWWQSFGDPQLTALVEKAAIENFDIRIAQKNLEQADALISQARSGLFPNVDAEGSLTRRQISETAGIPVGPGNPRIQDFYSTGLVSNWELDIFGGTRREISAAYARYQSLEEQKRDTLLLVLSEVARNYVELRGTQKRQAIIQSNIDLQQRRADLVKRRFDIGDASEFDYSRTLAQLQSTKARLPNVDGQIDTLIYRLSVLTGQPPEALKDELSLAKALPFNPEIVPIGLRSDLLRRRPDIRAAERELVAEVNDIGARTADLFPKFTLTGNIGYESIGADDFLSSASRVWSIGPGISWPIFSAGRIRAQINAEEAGAEAAALEYEKTVLLALEDAESAFTQYGRELETRNQLKQAVATRNNNLELSRKRYESGLDSLINLIDTEREALTSQEELVASETQTLVKLVRLYKSLGGGWESFEH